MVAKSSVLSKLKSGNRDIESSYKAHCRYKGKQLSQLKRRREEELATLFVKDPSLLLENVADDVNEETQRAEASAMSLEGEPATDEAGTDNDLAASAVNESREDGSVSDGE